MRDTDQPYEVAPGVRVLPVRTPTLPPATHTNAFLVGTEQAVLVEPASPFEDELQRMEAWVRQQNLSLQAILLTHHHGDHAGGAAQLASRLQLPLWAHQATADRLKGKAEFDRMLRDDEVIELQGPQPVALECMHTPGHAPGHLCFTEVQSGVMLAGDMVAGVGTILVEPGDGDMHLYLSSLERMAEREPSCLVPAHGGVIDDVQGKIDFYIRHRGMREQKVLSALRQHEGPATPEQLVPVAYDDAPKQVWPLAGPSTHAHLLKLVRDGVVEEAAGRFSLA